MQNFNKCNLVEFVDKYSLRKDIVLNYFNIIPDALTSIIRQLDNNKNKTLIAPAQMPLYRLYFEYDMFSIIKKEWWIFNKNDSYNRWWWYVKDCKFWEVLKKFKDYYLEKKSFPNFSDLYNWTYGVSAYILDTDFLRILWLPWTYWSLSVWDWNHRLISTYLINYLLNNKSIKNSYTLASLYTSANKYSNEFLYKITVPKNKYYYFSRRFIYNVFWNSLIKFLKWWTVTQNYYDLLLDYWKIKKSDKIPAKLVSLFKNTKLKEVLPEYLVQRYFNLLKCFLVISRKETLSKTQKEYIFNLFKDIIEGDNLELEEIKRLLNKSHLQKQKVFLIPIKGFWDALDNLIEKDWYANYLRFLDKKKLHKAKELARLKFNLLKVWDKTLLYVIDTIILLTRFMYNL